MRTASGTAPVTKGGRAPGAEPRYRAGAGAGAGLPAPEREPPAPDTAPPVPAAGRRAPRRSNAPLGCSPQGQRPLGRGGPERDALKRAVRKIRAPPRTSPALGSGVKTSRRNGAFRPAAPLSPRRTGPRSVVTGGRSQKRCRHSLYTASIRQTCAFLSAGSY